MGREAASTSTMKVHRMRDLNPLAFFRSPFIVKSSDGDKPAEPAPAVKAIPKVPSLLFEMELEDGHARSESDEPVASDVLRRLKSLVEPWTGNEHNLLLHVKAAREDAVAGGRALDASALAERLRRQGYAVSIRTALGGGGGGECLRNLRHTFLNVTLHGKVGAVSVIIDPKFREQFEIAHPTPRYATVLAAVPADFVGTDERIVPIVELLCSEMSAAFGTTGTAVPPWRQPASMLSKWRPRRSEEAAVGGAVPAPPPSQAVNPRPPPLSSALGRRAVSADGGSTSPAVHLTASCRRATEPLAAPARPSANCRSLLGALGMQGGGGGSPGANRGAHRAVVRELSRADAAHRACSLLAAELTSKNSRAALHPAMHDAPGKDAAAPTRQATPYKMSDLGSSLGGMVAAGSAQYATLLTGF